ncbi:MAG: helicase-associated domain-containing protein [Ardenticatenales bacterium]|nr:helicase-associated domain-containing protein [Ardenticatenales bacterium]
MSPETPSLKELLGRYRAAALKTMASTARLAEKGPAKEKLVAALVKALSQGAPERLAALDETARALFAEVQHAGGRADWGALLAVAQRAQIVTAVQKQKRYGGEELLTGSPLGQARSYQDVLARLEARGLLLGESALDPSKSVIDFGLAQQYVIPHEVAAQLPPPAPRQAVVLAPPAQVVVSEAAAFSRQLYALWSYLWKQQPVLLTSTQTLSKRDLKSLATLHPQPFDAAALKREDELPWLYFQRRLLQALGLVREGSGQLQGNPTAAEAYWDAPLVTRAAQWTRAWQEGDWWVELEHLGEVKWRPGSAFERLRAPARLREARTRLLASLAARGAGGAWLWLDDLLAQLQMAERDLLLDYQPNRYYYGYQMVTHRYQAQQNRQGWAFEPVATDSEGWQRVEGGLVQHVVHLLHWLGLVDLGRDAAGKLVALRLNTLGEHLLARGPAPQQAAASGGRIVLQPNFHLVAFGPVAERALLEVERFADRLGADQAIEFELTRASLYRAQQAGMDAGAVLSQLAELTGSPVPQNVARTLEEWQAAHERVVIRRQVSLLQVGDEGLLAQLLATPESGLRALSATMALVEQPAAAERTLQAAELAPVQGHDRSGRGGLTLSEEGVVQFRHQVPDIYLLGRVQQLAEEREGQWHLTSQAVERARQTLGLEAEAQLAAWRALLFGPEPLWLERRIKAWCHHYGQARLHTGPHLEVRDEAVLATLQSDPRLAPYLKRFKPRGPLLTVQAEELAELRALLAEYGIEVREP